MKHFIGLLMDAADGLLTILDLEELPGTRTWKHTMILVSNLQHVIRESYYLRWCFEWICIIGSTLATVARLNTIIRNLNSSFFRREI